MDTWMNSNGLTPRPDSHHNRGNGRASKGQAQGLCSENRGTIAKKPNLPRFIPRFVPRFRAGSQWARLSVASPETLDLPMKKASEYRYLEAFKLSYGRCERIRTFDPLHPMQVRYQAAPHTESSLEL